jgi:hypothetical protein
MADKTGPNVGEASPLDRLLRQLASCGDPLVARWAKKLLKGDREPARRPARRRGPGARKKGGP